MEFPRLVFTSPGPYDCQLGKYGSRQVFNDEEYEAALKAGFTSTLSEAFEKKPESEPSPVINDEKPKEEPQKPAGSKRGRKKNERE